MNPLLQTKMQGIEGCARDTVQRVLWRLLLGVTIGLIGLTGLGFLIASAYLALSAFLSAAWAASLVGLGLLLVAGIGTVIVNRSVLKTAKTEVPKPPPVALNTGASNLAPTVAFTLAFVLARHLTGPSRK